MSTNEIQCTAWDTVSDPDFSDLLGDGWQVAYGGHLWEADVSRSYQSVKLWRVESTEDGLVVHKRYVKPETPVFVRKIRERW